jgi:hypothetical protein
MDINYMSGGLPVDQFDNISTTGLCYREHGISPPANQAFYNETIPAGGANIIKVGSTTGAICGETGFISYAEGFLTTSQEKDGQALQLPLDLPLVSEGSEGEEMTGNSHHQALMLYLHRPRQAGSLHLIL